MEGLVIATNRLDNFQEWFRKWEPGIEAEGVKVFVMFDSLHWSDKPEMRDEDQVFNHIDVNDDLGIDNWIIPRHTSACKSYAIYRAWQAGCERIFCLDDDCYPADVFFEGHRAMLGRNAINSVYHTLRGVRVRGTPYVPSHKIMLSHGTWKNIPDVDAITQMNGRGGDIEPNCGPVPRGALFPFCGMNWACNREIIPLMYFGLQGESWGVDRFDDIWCGFIAKKILDHLGYAVWSGSPSIDHVRASDPFVNLEKEAPGYAMNVEFYEWIMRYPIKGNDPVECMDIIGHSMIGWGSRETKRKDYWRKYGEAICLWASLFKGRA